MAGPRLRILGRVSWCAGAVALCGVLSIRAAPPDGLSAADQAKAFAWFSSLDYPDVKTLPFILATIARRDPYSGSEYPPPPAVVAGFLVSDGPKEFKFFSLNRETITAAKSGDKVPPAMRLGFTRADLPEYVRFAIGSAGKANPNGREGYSKRFGWPPAYPTELFALAWACSRQGFDAQAKDLFDLVVIQYRIGNRKSSPYESILADIQQQELDRALYGLDYAIWNREQMLECSERFARLFPDCPRTPEVVRNAKTLRRMVAEDKQHAAERARGKAFDKLSKHDQIAELIFQLRDQTGCEPMAGGIIDLFMTVESEPHADPNGNTPAHRLLKYDYDAFPQLVDALDDDRFSRAMEQPRHSSKHYMLTIGDCAERILSKLTAHEFQPYVAMSQEHTTAKVKADASAWYADVQKRGEKQVLIELVENEDNTDAAEILARKYPDAALEPIRIALRNAAERPWQPARYVLAVAKIPGDGPIPFFQERAKFGKGLDERLAAAVALVERNHPDGVATLVYEWKHSQGENNLLFSLILAMLNSQSSEAIDALASGLKDRPLDDRFCVVDALFQNGRADALFGIERRRHVPLKKPLTPSQLQAKDAIVELLVKSLADTGQKNGNYRDYFVHKSLVNPRICDVAGFDLNRFDPERFAFDIEAPLPEREKNRVAIINAERR
jgi:hypothetical protein